MGGDVGDVVWKGVMGMLCERGCEYFVLEGV